jgi:2-polyprenyl-3-methyl-5-hydroxy-6-metoxy-1,4-benzoquinol methylase
MSQPSDLLSFNVISKKLKDAAKRSLPAAAIQGIQSTIRPLRRAKLRVESSLHPRQFLEDPFPKVEVHHVRPQEINYWGRRPNAVFSPWRDRGRILDGDWDREINDLHIEQTSLYTSYKLRLETGIGWSDTPYYQHAVKQIEKGEVRWNCRNAAEFDSKCKEWDEVFNSIRDEGYIANKGEDEISVNIDRDGRLMLNDGYHRLIFSKLLGVPWIPVMVLVRHRKWHDFRREVYEFIQSGTHSPPGLAYVPLLHMDLQSVPSQHGHDRYEIIRKHLRGKRILDIGAHLGYFSHRFEELGHECVAVESHADICHFLRKLHAAQERKFRIVEESIFSFVERERPAFDSVLALSILHHFLKEESSYHQLVKLLNNLEVKEMIFEPHNPAERQMRDAFQNFDSRGFVNFILENSRLTQAEQIGIAKDGREIFRLF